MTFALGVFDVIAYMVPGSLYAALLIGYFERFTSLRLADAAAASGSVTAISCVVAAFALGHATYGLGRMVDRRLPGGSGGSSITEARRISVERLSPWMDASVLDVDPALLLTSIQMRWQDIALDILRLRASAVMMRNCVVPLGIGCLSLAGFAIQDESLNSAVGAALLAALAVGAVFQGRMLAQWSFQKTYEASVWLPRSAVGEAVPGYGPSPTTANRGLPT